MWRWSGVTDLEERVAELEARIEVLEAERESQHSVVGRDRYDSAVIDELVNVGESVSISRIQAWYRQTGVRSDDKIRNRIKDLHDAGFIENVGTSHWRYVGPRQEQLGETA